MEEKSFKRLYSRTKAKATSRNIDFLLPYPIFKYLIKQHCYYCGQEPTATNNGWALKGFTFNGLDRVDNLKPYEPSNLVACCYQCNSMKSSYTYQEFVDKIKAIYLRIV